jgi:hypothetical protein
MTKRPNAYTQALQERQQRIMQPENRKTAAPQNSTTEHVQEHDQDEEKATEKLTLYLFPRQSDKLDALIVEYKKRTGKRVQRNKLMRMLIDQASLEAILE